MIRHGQCCGQKPTQSRQSPPALRFQRQKGCNGPPFHQHSFHQLLLKFPVRRSKTELMIGKPGRQTCAGHTGVFYQWIGRRMRQPIGNQRTRRQTGIVTAKSTKITQPRKTVQPLFCRLRPRAAFPLATGQIVVLTIKPETTRDKASALLGIPFPRVTINIYRPLKSGPTNRQTCE